MREVREEINRAVCSAVRWSVGDAVEAFPNPEAPDLPTDP